jgi:hypothetical protein
MFARAGLVCLAALLLSGAAFAQTKSSVGGSLTIAAGAPDPDKEQEHAVAHGQEEPVDAAEVQGEQVGDSGAGLRGTFGRTLSKNTADGWFGRIELEAFVTEGYKRAGPVGGALLGGEVWTSPDGGGGGLPMSLFLGYRSPVFFTTIGAGVDLFVYDRIDDDGGFGVYAPFGAATMGLDFGGFRLLADGRAIERWQWGAPDRPQLQVGLTLSQVLETTQHRRPRDRSRTRSR